MFKQQVIDQLSETVTNMAKNLPISDIENNVKAVVSATLTKLNLVSREEFETQQKVLNATREKINQLEEKINQLLNK